MEQISDNILRLTPGDPLVLPPGNEGALKILLIGTNDLSGNTMYDWQTKFCLGLAELCDPQKGLMMFKGQQYIIYDSRAPLQNPDPTMDNPEFVQKNSWTLDAALTVDGIFCNFLKKSQAVLPLALFTYLETTKKMVVRLPTEYIYYPIVRFFCERDNIPCLDSKHGNVLSVLQSMYSYIPSFQSNQKLQLPE